MSLHKDEDQVKRAKGWKEERKKTGQVPHAEAPTIGWLMRSRRRFRRLSAPWAFAIIVA